MVPSDSDGEPPRPWVKWGVVLLLAVLCSLAVEAVEFGSVNPRVLYWPTSPDVVPIVMNDDRGVLARATVNPPGLDLVVALDGLDFHPRWTSHFSVSTGATRQISTVGPNVVVVSGNTVRFLDGSTGRIVETLVLPDMSDGFCISPQGDSIWVRLLNGEHRRLKADGTQSVGARPTQCRSPLRPRGDGGIRVRHDGDMLHVEGAEWRWQGESTGAAGSWPRGAWDKAAKRVYVGTLTSEGPGIEVLEKGQHVRRIGVASGGRVPHFTVFDDTVIVPHDRRWDLYSASTGRRVGQHPDPRRSAQTR